MSTRLSLGSVALTAALALWLPSSVSAQAAVRRYPDQGPTLQQPGGLAYDNGYRYGVDRGQRDASAGRQSNYRDEKEYRDASRGWNGYGNRNGYRDEFRRGYEVGYRAGYARYGRGRYRNDPGYPGVQYGRVAFDRGFRDGFEEGHDAARRNRRYDPLDEKDYRKADHGYDRRYGSRDAYKDDYRHGFRAGYHRGYGEALRWPY